MYATKLSRYLVPCDEDVTPVRCLVDPCLRASCRRFPDAQCVTDYCGGCFARWFQDRREVECEGMYMTVHI